MKVYVCYKAWMYEGCSEPQAVFDTEDKAKAWCERNKKKAEDVEYMALEVD